MFTVLISAARTMEKGVAGIQPRAKRLLKQRILMLKLCYWNFSWQLPTSWNSLIFNVILKWFSVGTSEMQRCYVV